jgi:hypothetical protein
MKEKPTLGVMPKHLWRESRMELLADAIRRKLELQETVPEHWVQELNELWQSESFERKPGARIETIEGLKYWRSVGVDCFAILDQRHCEYKTSAARVVGIKDGNVRLSHWTHYWVRFDDPSIAFIQGS